MYARMHQQLMMRTRAINSISDWFSGGGLGVWYHVDPAYCFTDALGTTNATVGQSVRRINCRGGSGFFMSNTGVSTTLPVLQYDSVLDRYYLDFTAASVQRLGGQDSSNIGDWIWLHNGNEWQMVVLGQFGKSSNPGTVMTFGGTNQGSFTQIGAIPLYFDDRVAVPRNNALVIMASPGGNNQLLNSQTDNVATPNTVAIYSSSWINDNPSADDFVIRVNGSQVAAGENSAIFNPSAGNPQARFTLGATNGTSLPMDGRIYALAIMRGSGARANVVNFEGTI